MLSDRILKNKEFFTFKSLRDSFKSEFLPTILKKTTSIPQHDLEREHEISFNNGKEDYYYFNNNNENDIQKEDQLLNEKLKKKSKKTIKESPSTSTAITNIEPVTSSLFFSGSSSLLQFRQNETSNNNTEKKHISIEVLNKNNHHHQKTTSKNESKNKAKRKKKNPSNSISNLSPTEINSNTKKIKSSSVVSQNTALTMQGIVDTTVNSTDFDHHNTTAYSNNNNNSNSFASTLKNNFSNLFTNECKDFLKGSCANSTNTNNNNNSSPISSNSSTSTTSSLRVNKNLKINSSKNSIEIKVINNNTSKNFSINNKANSHNNEEVLNDLPYIKSGAQDYDYYNQQNIAKQSLTALKSIKKAKNSAFYTNNNNKLIETQTLQSKISLNKQNSHSGTTRIESTCVQIKKPNKLPALPPASSSSSSSSASIIPPPSKLVVEAPSAKTLLSHKMKLINNLSENKPSANILINNTNEDIINITTNTTSTTINPNESKTALNFLNCLEKNKKLLKKFYENIDWNKIKEETEIINLESNAVSSELNTSSTDTMKLQVKDKVKNFYKTNNPYRSSGGLGNGIGSASSGGLHWINIATTNTSLKKSSTGSKQQEFTPTNSSNNVAKELIRIINNVTTMSNVTSAANLDVEPLLSPSTENLNSSITISTISSNKNNTPGVNRLHFLKVDGQRVDYIHTLQSSSSAGLGPSSRKTHSSLAVPNQPLKMSLPKSSLTPSMSSVTNLNSILSTTGSTTGSTTNIINKKSNTNIIDLSNYRTLTNLDFIKQTVRETFDGRGDVKFPELANSNSKNLDISAVSSHSTSDKSTPNEAFEQPNSSLSLKTKTTNLTETDLLEYFKNKRKAKTQLTHHSFTKMINENQRTGSSMNGFVRGDTSLNLRKSDELLGHNNELFFEKEKRAESPQHNSKSPSPISGVNLTASNNINNFSERTNKLKKRLARIRNKNLNQLNFAATLAATVTVASNKKLLYGDSIATISSASKDAKVVKEIRNMYETSLNKNDFSNNLDGIMIENSPNNNDSEKGRCLFNISRNEIIDILNNSQDTKENELNFIKNSRCSYNSSRIDNEKTNSKDEDLNVTSIIRELKENEFKESFKIEMEEFEVKRKNSKSSEFTSNLCVDTVTSKLQACEIESNTNLPKESIQLKNESENKNLDNKDQTRSTSSSLANQKTAHFPEIETRKSSLERSSSKNENEKTEKVNNIKEPIKTTLLMNKINSNITNRISLQKNQLNNKKSKALTTNDPSINTTNKQTDLIHLIDEEPLTKSKKIYTQIANSTSQPLPTDDPQKNNYNEEILDLDFAYYSLLANKENEFIRNELQANRLQRKIFKKLRIEKNIFNSNSYANALICNSFTNFNSNSFVNAYGTNNINNIRQLNNNLYGDCYKFYERSRNTE